MPVKPPRPYYVPVGNEEQVFKAAFRQGLSIMLKGPTRRDQMIDLCEQPR
jgi:nitric oxide reductase NorQ protein